MKELGLDGSSLNSLVKGPAEQTGGFEVKDDVEEEAAPKALPANGKSKDAKESGGKNADA